MTRKDYVVLAQALKAATPLAMDGTPAMRAWHDCVDRVSIALASDNSRFDRARFRAACGCD